MHFPNWIQHIGPRLEERLGGPWVKLLFGTGACVERVDALIPALLRIRDRRGRPRRLRPNRVQQSYARNRSRRNIILKARQVGMTTYVAARFFLQTLLCPGTVTLQVAHTQESAEQIFRIIRRFFDQLPASLGKAILTERSTFREVALATSDSRYIVDTAGNPRVGRGLTVHNLHASEVAFWPGNPQETMAGLLAAVAPQGEVDVESTANGVGGYFHTEWLRAQSGEPGSLTPHFFPWWLEPDYTLPIHQDEKIEPYTPEEELLREKRKVKPEQVKFRRWLHRMFGERALQEFAETDVDCFLLSGQPVFEIAAIEARLRDLPAPVTSRHNEALLIWHEPQRGRHYIIGADVAEGRQRGDFSAAVVVDAETGLQCAELLARWPLYRFAEELDRLGRHYNHALLAVERNNQGHAVLLELERHRLYPKPYRHVDGELGWLMNAQTKPQAIQVLDAMLRDAPQAFASKRLLEQCRSFSYSHDSGDHRSPKGDAGPEGASSTTSELTAHDDLVIAAAITHAVRARSRPVELLSVAR